VTVDTVIFDVDGVLVDTDASYTEAVLRTVRWLVPDAPVDRSLVRRWRATGDWNNDWDLTDGLYCWLRAEPRLPAAEAARRTLAELRAAAGPRAALDHRAVQGLFEEHYNGTAVAVARYGVTPRLHNDAPLARDEPILLGPEVLPALASLGITKVGVVTGRARPDWEAVRPRLALPPTTVIATDEDGRKPDPAPLRRVLAALESRGAVVVGDTINDLRMTQACDRAGPVRAWCVIRCAPDESEHYLAAGAVATIRTLAELPAVVRGLVA
jgi:HAD superfamily hydrolase (TIGR01548 family)